MGPPSGHAPGFSSVAETARGVPGRRDRGRWRDRRSGEVYFTQVGGLPHRSTASSTLVAVGHQIDHRAPDAWTTASRMVPRRW